MNNRRLGRHIGRLAVAGALVAGAAAVQAPASAAGISYVWQNDANGWVAIYSAPHTGTTPHHWSKSGTKFAMNCWLDNQGQRWFWGQIYDTGSWKYVRASQVRNQISVRAC
ncbi:hypothetical protein [Streptomyces yangpuensis]|uniref:hypothetical protein n=1 Tax=Streptomyces yangpuensis TaxID=1648182 RepID=UPI00380815C7